MGKNSLFNKWYLEHWITTGRKNKIGPLFYTTHTNNSNGLTTYIRPDTVKLLEENKGKMFLDVDLDNDFWDMTQKHKQQKQKQVKLHQTKKLMHSNRYNLKSHK